MKYRQNTYTNKPLAINEGKHQWMIKAIIAILFLLLINNIILRAEGTSSIAPSTKDEAALFIGAGNTGSTGGDYGEFAWKGSDSKLSFNIQNTCEKVYFGFSAPKRSRTFSGFTISDIDYSLLFRIIDPQGNPINDLACFGNKMIEGEVWQTLGEEDINLSSRVITDLGPANLRSGGYIPFELDLSACGLTLTGNYAIEFFTQRVNYDPNVRTAGFYIEYFDVTVANCTNQAIKGRLWSNNWGFAVKNDGDGPFDRAFNGAFYICSKEGFISKINFNTGTNNRAEAGKNNDQQSGFRAGAFNVSLNTMGPNKTGNIQTDRQSVWAENSTNPELAVFLNLPDPAFCPPQAIGAFKAKNKFLSGCPGDYCINLAFSKPGQVELLIEATNGNRKFDDPVEVRLVREVVETDRVSNPEDANYPYEICVPWSGKDGAGNFVDFSKIFISGFYFQGIYHFPVYDAEFNDDGFTVETVRPALGLQELFYDDRQILADNLTGESKDGTNGCDAPCHRWTGEYVASADQTQIFGNFNTINTWWFANSTFKDFSLQPGLRPAIICPPDYTGCPGDDISPNLIGNAEVSTSNPECTVINYEDRVLAQGTNCSSNIKIERKWSVYLTGLEEDRIECVQIITLEDKSAPTLVGIPADETVLCDAIPVVANSISANDGCNSLAELTIAFNEEKIAGNCAGNYQLKRSWTATDQCGNEQTATQTITVIDDIAPVLRNIPADETVACDAIPATSNNVSATDNCEANESISIVFEEMITAGACKGNYTITRSWTATDNCGNASLATQTITVIDIVAPVLVNIPTDKMVSCDAIPMVANNISANDECNSVAELTIVFKEENIAGNCTGNYQLKRTWTATDPCGNSSTATQTITVIDDSAPTLMNTPADETVSCDAIPSKPTDIFAADNCSPATAISITLEEERIDGDCNGNFFLKRTWTATDACENQTIQTQTITVIDTVAPILISIPDDLTVSCESVPASATVTATDNCEAIDNISIVFKELRLNGSCEGNYILKRAWTAIDKCGNINFGEQLITVKDTTAPIFLTCPSDTTVLAMEDCNSAVLTIPIPAITDNCNSAARVVSSVDLTQPFPMGTTVVIFTAIDDCGNTSTCEFLVTVKNAPQDNCPADIRVTADNCDSITQTANISWEPPTGNECCSACPQNTDLEGFIFLGERGGHRYYYAKEALSWFAASRLSDDLGGYLVTINDPAENAFLNSFIVEKAVYIGLSDQGDLGEFYWQNEDVLNYTNWADNAIDVDPEETQVAQLSPDGFWQKTDGMKAARFLLEIPCMDVIQLSGPLNGSAFSLGTTNITYLIDYDNCANADTCSFSVTVDSCQIAANLGQYCGSTAADTTCFWIEKVIVDQTENESGNNGGYGDFTNLLTPLFKGLEQTLVLNPGYAPGHTFNVYWKVWIDFSQDGIFDMEELIFTTKEYRPVAVNFTIPATAKLGHTRMRIALNFVDEDDPCSLLAFGEVEDYLVNISEINPGVIADKDPNENQQTTSFKILDDSKYTRPILGVTPMTVVAARQTQLVVFPNPASKQLTVQIEDVNNWLNHSTQQNYDLFIYNQIGQVVKQEKLTSSDLNNTQINVADLAKGIYFIQIKLGGTKILKQKFLKMED